MIFYQRDWEPLYNAWWRCKKLLAWFLYHGMPKEWILENFLNGLCYTSREWVERGNRTTFFYQLSIGQAYYMLEDMAKYNYWYLSGSMNNQGWENNSKTSNNMKPWTDTPPQNMETSSELQDFFTDCMERINENIEGMKEAQKRTTATMRRMAEREKHLELFHDDDDSLSEDGIGDLIIEELSATIPPMEAPVVNMDECHLEEPIPSKEHLEIYGEDSLSEDEI